MDLNLNDVSESFKLNDVMLQRSTSWLQKKISNVTPLSGMNRNKSAGSNSSLPQEKVPKIYVENKLNKTKSLNLWNNNIVEDMQAMDIGTKELALGLDEISEDLVF